MCYYWTHIFGAGIKLREDLTQAHHFADEETDSPSCPRTHSWLQAKLGLEGQVSAPRSSSTFPQASDLPASTLFQVSTMEV